jgi:hypothetical protein
MFKQENVKSLETIAVEEKNRELAQRIEQRKAAYKAESDPLYMEWKFEQSTESEQVWRDKVLEIKTRIPLVD